MKRFLMLVGVAVVAAAMYVAASPASQQAKGPTAKQFKALKKQVAALSTKVATLSKAVKTTETDLNTLAFAYVHCSLHSSIGLGLRGDPGGSFGYSFNDGVNSTFTTALDVVPVGPTYVVTSFDAADSVCQSLVGAAPLRHHEASALAQTLAEKRP